MSNDYSFATTLATIATKAQARWRFLDPDNAVAFAWYSVNTDGDASEDDNDLQRHFEYWLADVHETTLPSWLIGS